jgi:hypothetical protein
MAVLPLPSGRCYKGDWRRGGAGCALSFPAGRGGGRGGGELGRDGALFCTSPGWCCKWRLRLLPLRLVLAGAMKVAGEAVAEVREVLGSSSWSFSLAACGGVFRSPRPNQKGVGHPLRLLHLAA